jgi:RimJ/RimL family protein N-acetyltransferase
MKELNLQPHLCGELLELRPLLPSDWAGLFAAGSDPEIWKLHPDPERWKEPAFRKYFEGGLASKGALVAVDRKTGEIIGSSRYQWNGPDELEIGWTFLACSRWGGEFNREMKRLMLDHAFQSVPFVAFYIGVSNWRSRKAVEKIGGILTDRLSTRPVGGQPVEHVIYELSKSNWNGASATPSTD